MWKERINKLNFLVLCLLSCFPILSMKMTVAFIIAFTSISTISSLIFGLPLINKTRIKEVLLLLTPFLLIFLRTYITDRTPESLFYLEVSLSLLAFPAAFFFLPVQLKQKQFDILSLLFSVSTLLITLYGEIKTGMKLSHYVGDHKFWPTISDVFRDQSFPYYFRTVFEEQAHIHPTYASIFLGISVLLILDRLLRIFSGCSRPSKILYIGSLALFVLAQALLASRTPFLATMLCSVVLIFVSLKRKIYAIYAFGGILAISVLLMWMVPSISSRFKEITFSNVNAPSEANENSINIRVGIFQCSTEMIKENWIWGIGPGKVQKTLNDCYTEISKAVYDQKNYNTHNQFFDYWAGLGIAGPLALLLIMGYVSVKNYKIKNPVPLTISLLFLIAMLTENVLIRQNGIVPFAFFTSLYFFNAKTHY